MKRSEAAQRAREAKDAVLAALMHPPTRTPASDDSDDSSDGRVNVYQRLNDSTSDINIQLALAPAAQTLDPIIVLLQRRLEAVEAENVQLRHIVAQLNSDDSTVNLRQSMRNVGAYMQKTTQHLQQLDADSARLRTDLSESIDALRSQLVSHAADTAAQIAALKLAPTPASSAAPPLPSDGDIAALRSQLASLAADNAAQFAALKLAPEPASSAAPPQPSADPASKPTAWAPGSRPATVLFQPPQHPHPRGLPHAGPASGLASSTLQQTCFVVAGSMEETASLEGLRGAPLLAQLTSLLSERLSLPREEVCILDAYPINRVLPTDPASKRRRFFIRVASLVSADTLVRSRHKLKGSQLGVFDELSPVQLTAHRRLWLTYLRARSEGHSAQFLRARLVVTKALPDGSITKTIYV